MSKYTIGVDYGSLSGRAVLVDVATGEELASSVYEYPHAVMETQLPDGTKLGHDWALQHPQDYLDVLSHTIPAVLKEAGVSNEDVIGVGTDFTACTILPVKADGTPLCFLPEYKNRPHAYVKMWKHHAAQDKANMLNEIAEKRGETWLKNYGGKISSEWAIPKIWQILDEDEEIYNAMDRFIEAADWIIWQLCGKETRNSCTAGYKAMFNKRLGYPSDDFFKALDTRLEHVIDEKFSRDITPLGGCAGYVTEKAAALTGLKVGTAVAIGNVDAHVCVPAVGIDGPGKMLAIMGTSTCHMMMGTTETQVPGICGVVEVKLMKKHAAFMKPKFEAVLSTLDREIAPLEIASWSHPKGGYFVSFDAMPGTAKRTLALCKEAGVAMTAAGATFPYGIDPNDSNIRIAPSFPPVEDVEKAIAVFCTCVKMSALEKLGV